MKKKRFKLQNVVKRMIAMLTIVSMTVTGFGMMDSSAFNGVLSGDGTLSGDSELSGDAFEDDNFIVENIANGMVSASSTEDIFSCILETGDDAVEYAKKSYKRIKGAKFKSVYAQYYELNHSKDTIKTRICKISRDIL